MWCGTCQAEVPGIVSPTRQQVCCARCGKPLSGDSLGNDLAVAPAAEEQVIPFRPADKPSSAAPMSALESWELDEDLRHMQRLLRRDASIRLLDPSVRWDPGHLDLPESPDATEPGPLGAMDRGVRAVRIVGGAVLLWLGLSAVVCGLVLFGWAWLGPRPDLWMAGLAAVAVGQAALLLSAAIRPRARFTAPPAPRMALSPEATLLLAGAEEPASPTRRS